MRILMLGNSFTYFNDMPRIVEQLLGAEVVSHTRGGAFLSEQLNMETEMGAKTLKALKEEKWDYVVMQEQSRAPVFCKEKFHESVRELCRFIKASGAKPVLYASWAYREGSEKLAGTEMSYAEMDRGLYESYHEAAKENGALTADVGKAFTAIRGIVNLYEPDDYHPSAAGSMLAAHCIAKVIEEDWRLGK